MTHRPSVHGGVQDAVLDFYGVPVRAQDVRQFADRMRLLADKVGESARPDAVYKLEMRRPGRCGQAVGQVAYFVSRVTEAREFNIIQATLAPCCKAVSLR